MPAGLFTILIYVNETDSKDETNKETRQVQRFEIYIKYTELLNLLSTIATHDQFSMFQVYGEKIGSRKEPRLRLQKCPQ